MQNNYVKLGLIILGFSIITLLTLFVTPFNFSFNKIILNIRVNKIVTLATAGASVSLGSYIAQILIKNKKADISTIGINAMNILLIITIALIAGTNTLLLWQDNYLIALVFLTSIGSTILIWILNKWLFYNNNQIIIVGIILILFASSLGFIIMSKLKIHEQEAISSYINGTILINNQNGLNIQNIVSIITLVVGVIWTFVFGNKLLLISQDEIKAKSLGIKVEWIKFFAILVIGINAAVSFISMGNVMFIGFAIGNINHLIFKDKVKYSLFGSLFLGAIVSIGSYWVFNYLLNFKTYEGIYIILVSGILLFISLFLERWIKWKKQS